MKLTLGFSPCPNDTFIFDALVNQKIDSGDLSFEVLLEDVQTLNNMALEGRLDVTKISFGVLPLIVQKYGVLNSGSALGMGVGPLLICKDNIPSIEKIKSLKIAIPGKDTTAHLLFSLAFPDAFNKEFMVFNEVEDAVLSGRVDAGVIIHENRFTYQQKGLLKIRDLGAYWEESNKMPIPLGGIVMRKSFSNSLQKKTDSLIKKSLEFAFAKYPEISPYVKLHAQEMDIAVMRQHIDLYVNGFSLDLGIEGKNAVRKLFEVYRKTENHITNDEAGIFLLD